MSIRTRMSNAEPVAQREDGANVRSAAVVGAGTMGAGIAMTFANAGIGVTLVDTSAVALARAGTAISQTYESAVTRGRMKQDVAQKRLASIYGTKRFDELAEVDVAVEAVFEDLSVKRDVFARLGAVCRADALLATNTSTLDVDAISRAAPHPERAVGLHFFSPAHVMKLLEVVRGSRTSRETLGAAVSLAARLGKVPVVVGNADGFVGNRMLLSYKREAEFMLLAGASPRRVDAALEAFGFAMGIFAVSDLAGIDVGYRAKQERLKRGAAPAFTVTDLPDVLVAAGRLGQKAGRGYYRYEDGSRVPLPDADLEPLVQSERDRLGQAIQTLGDDAIVERCVYALVKEGAHILEDGVAACAADVDTIWRNGYGFPEARGGPMAYAQSIGVQRVLTSIRRFAQQDPEFWRVSPTLVEAAETGRFR